MKISILGYGNFGSGFGEYLSRLNHEIIKEEVGDAELVFVSVPSFAVVPVLLGVKEKIIGKKIVICSKGFTDDGKLIGDVLKENAIDDIFFLYGPTLIEGIVKGEISAEIVYEDDNFIVINDAHPVSEGHCLILSKRHYETLFDLPSTFGGELVALAKAQGLRLIKESKAEGIKFVNNNFEAAGQVVKHFHLHVIPHKKGKTIGRV